MLHVLKWHLRDRLRMCCDIPLCSFALGHTRSKRLRITRAISTGRRQLPAVSPPKSLLASVICWLVGWQLIAFQSLKCAVLGFSIFLVLGEKLCKSRRTEAWGLRLMQRGPVLVASVKHLSQGERWVTLFPGHFGGSCVPRRVAQRSAVDGEGRMAGPGAAHQLTVTSPVWLSLVCNEEPQ